jgi:hypothetical protein
MGVLNNLNVHTKAAIVRRFRPAAAPENKIKEFIENNNSIGMDEGLEGPDIDAGSKTK